VSATTFRARSNGRAFQEAAELALIVQHPDAPLSRPVTHLIAYGVDPRSSGAPEGASEAARAGFASVEGRSGA
jgi:phosphatidylethanolamine-binding protein (PEBP) family uncharacterized protein